MKVFVHDHTGNQQDGAKLSGLKLLQARFGAVFAALPSDLPEGSVAFVHAGVKSGRRDADWRSVASSSKHRFIVFVSSIPHELRGSGDGWCCCRRPLEQVIGSGDLDKILTALNTGRVLVELLDVFDVSALYALRLLCEAWRERNRKPMELNDIPIFPPESPAEWRQPFDTDTAKATNVSIAALMGNDEEMTKKLLEAVDKGDDAAINALMGKLFPSILLKENTSGSADQT
jgi:hypothetical protein